MILRPCQWILSLVVLAGSAQSLSAQNSGELDRKLFESGGAGQGDRAMPDDARRLDRELGAAAVSEDQQPLVEVVQRMRTVEQRLLRGDCGPPTQQSQREIVSELDRLIHQARSQAQPSSARQSSTANQDRQGRKGDNQAAAQPGDQAGAGRKPGGQPKPRPAGATRPSPEQLPALFGHAWGQLPEQVRQQLIQQWSREQFLPEYAPMIEQYFRRLTEAEEDRR